MRLIAILIVIYIPLAFAYKFQNELTNEWKNYYWLFSSIFYGLLSWKIQTFRKIDYFKAKYHPKDLKLYRFIIGSFAVYWGIILLIRIYVAFNIDKYGEILRNTGKYTIGAYALIILIIIITLQTWHRK